MTDDDLEGGLTAKLTAKGFGEGSNDWESWDLPTLRGIHQALDESPDRPNHVRLSRLVVDWGIPEAERWQIERAVLRLMNDGLIRAQSLNVGGGRRPVAEIIQEILPQGLRQLGVWPNEQTGLEALAAALREGAERTEPVDPEAASRLRQVAAWFLAGGREVAVGVGQAYLDHLVGLR